MAHKFTFSVIVPIYNVEDYLREALDSVIHQTMDFKSNIQLILINDGSSDSSEAICLEYKKQYPENITYIYKENGGVSSARNMGFDYVEGKYVTFLDPDDMWEENSFQAAYRFLEKHYDEIDVLAARIKFFEAKTNFHSLDYKFWDGTRVADLTKDEDIFCVESTAATTFIKAEAIGNIRFDSRLKYGEDSTFINKIMLKKRKYGLICEAMYYYRRRATGNSAVNNQIFDKSFYQASLEYYHLELFRYSKELYGEVIPYVQAMVGYDIMWRFANPDMPTVLDEAEQQEYFARLKEILSQIDDRYLLENPIHKAITKKYDAMYYKYGIDLLKRIRYDAATGKLMYEDHPILNLQRNKSKAQQVVSVRIEKDTLKVEALVARWLLACTETGGTYFFTVNGKKHPTTVEDYNVNELRTSKGNEYFYYLASMELPITEAMKQSGKTLVITPCLQYGDEVTTLSMEYGKFVPNTNMFKGSYQFFGDCAVKSFRTSIRVYFPKNKAYSKLKWDIKAIYHFLKKKQYDVIKNRYIRFPLFQKRQQKKGSIWLISDRIDNAGDNGEVLFKYICEHKPDGVRPIFVIGEMAKPAVKERLEAIGEVVYAEDKRYPFYFLMADKIISSSAGEFTINAFESKRGYYIDLYHFTYYFMNHGVNCGDCSKWLNRFNKNIHIFFTTGESERRNIIERNYNYGAENVQITGLARFDALYDNPLKQLLILPTWRRAYRQCYDDKTSSIYFDGFKETEFYRFYNGLMNDERLLEVMRRKGYRGLFCLHPIFMQQYVDFVQNDVFSVNEGFVDYNKAFAESSVMVTDYSTIAFDFAFLNKPIVYTQFDKEEFYANQIYDECFDYANEGFGPVCEDLDSAVNALIDVIENDCKNQYLDRIDRFFVYHDQNNAKRILEAVLADDEK